MSANPDLNFPKYKIVELSTVTEETIETVLNRWSFEGWIFDQIQFVVRDASRRPSMAFIFFVKPRDGSDAIPDYEVLRDQPEEDECDCCDDDFPDLPDDCADSSPVKETPA